MQVEGIYYQGITGFKQDMSGPRGPQASAIAGVGSGSEEEAGAFGE